MNDISDLAPEKGEQVSIGDRLWNGYSFGPPITHFDTPPADSFAARYFGQGVRIPFAGRQPIMRPVVPGEMVLIKVRVSECEAA